MSHVTGVVLVTAVSDRDQVSAVNAWLEASDFGPLVEVDDHGGGTKHPECTVLVAGYNGFGRIADFAEFVIGRPWKRGESVVLIVNPPDMYPVQVFRVPEERWSFGW